MSHDRAERILQHGFALKRIFPHAADLGPVTLYKSVLRLEREAHRLAVQECNEPLPEGYSERKEASILRRLNTLLGYEEAGVPILLNGDPRGYALKIPSEYVKAYQLDIDTDWGGYGILAPDF